MCSSGSLNNSEIILIQNDSDRFDNHKRNLYDSNGKLLTIKKGYGNYKGKTKAKKGKTKEALAEECADLLILLIGTAISANLDLSEAFWQKMEKIEQRPSRMIDGRIRVSEFGS